MPVVIIAARRRHGKTGHETPAEFAADREMLTRIEAIRRKAGEMMGMGDVSGLVVPKPVLARGGASRTASRHPTSPLMHAIAVMQQPVPLR